MKQEQFLEVLDRDEAKRRYWHAIEPVPLPPEEVELAGALGRVLAADVVASVDVPGFDRSNMDGYAVVAADTFGATEKAPIRLRLTGETLTPGRAPAVEVRPGTASPIATGAVVPRGADAVVLVEATDEEDGALIVRRAVTPGTAVTFAGTDVANGETVMFAGDVLTSRDTGVLAAIGRSRVHVHRRPRVAILSTGDEVIPPGHAPGVGTVFDSNARAIADAAHEAGGVAVELGIVPDDAGDLRRAITGALAYDVVLVSGGTSKGPGDVAYRVLDALPPPGIVVHGVALKPGKPLCLAAAGRTPVVLLPGFPTSAIFTFHEFVAPLIRRLAGLHPADRATLEARLAVAVPSERGRTEYLLVHLLPTDGPPAAYPMGKGSGSVTTWSQADGFVTIDANTERVDEGREVTVTLMGRDLVPRDLSIVGSHCVGLDVIVSALRERGLRTKLINVGSEAGLRAAKRGECDVAGIHLLDVESGVYNRPFVDDSLELVAGYGRMQGVVFRQGDARFDGKDATTAVHDALEDADVVMVNRNVGSGTRILIDRLVGERRPRGHANQARTHNAVAAAVASGRADFGVAIETVARDAGLGFLPLTEERYDFVLPKARLERPAARAFVELLRETRVRDALRARGFRLNPDAPGSVARARFDGA